MTDGTQAMTIRLPGPLYEQLRRAAFDAHIPMSQVVIAAIRKELGNEDH